MEAKTPSEQRLEEMVRTMEERIKCLEKGLKAKADFSMVEQLELDVEEDRAKAKEEEEGNAKQFGDLEETVQNVGERMDKLNTFLMRTEVESSAEEGDTATEEDEDGDEVELNEEEKKKQADRRAKRAKRNAEKQAKWKKREEERRKRYRLDDKVNNVEDHIKELKKIGADAKAAHGRMDWVVHELHVLMHEAKMRQDQAERMAQAKAKGVKLGRRPKYLTVEEKAAAKRLINARHAAAKRKRTKTAKKEAKAKKVKVQEETA